MCTLVTHNVVYSYRRGDAVEGGSLYFSDLMQNKHTVL